MALVAVLAQETVIAVATFCDFGCSGVVEVQTSKIERILHSAQRSVIRPHFSLVDEIRTSNKERVRRKTGQSAVVPRTNGSHPTTETLIASHLEGWAKIMDSYRSGHLQQTDRQREHRALSL